MILFYRLIFAAIFLSGLLTCGCGSSQKREEEAKLIQAVWRTNVTEVKRLLHLGVNPNTTNEGNPVLMYAAQGGNDEIAKLLIRAGADVNGRSWTEETALMWACAEGHDSTASLLLAEGADINAKDSYGEAPLIDAVEGIHVSTVALLIHSGANVNVVDNLGSTPLSEAIKEQQDEIVRLLVSAGAKNENGSELTNGVSPER